MDPVDNNGKFTAEAGEFAGLFAFTEGTSAVIDAIAKRGALVLQNDYVHKYPYDWRTKKPVMLRSTAQWFANVEGLQKEAVKALQSVKMVPDACKYIVNISSAFSVLTSRKPFDDWNNSRYHERNGVSHVSVPGVSRFRPYTMSRRARPC